MSNTKNAVDALKGVPQMVSGFPNILYVGEPGSVWVKEMRRQHPGQVYDSLQSAINAVPAGDGSATFGFYNTHILMNGYNVVTSSVVVPLTKSGIKIVGVGPHAGASGLYAATDLGAGEPILEILGYNCAVENFRVWQQTTATAGDGIHLGNASYTANYAVLKNVEVYGSENGTYKDFENCIVIADSKYATLEDVRVWTATGATAGISIVSGLGNGNSYLLKNVHSHVMADTGDAVIPLLIAADQEDGVVEGGSYICQSTADAIEVGADRWTFTGGGLAANESAVSADAAPLDNNGTGTIYGEFYVKQIGGSTAASLVAEA